MVPQHSVHGEAGSVTVLELPPLVPLAVPARQTFDALAGHAGDRGPSRRWPAPVVDQGRGGMTTPAVR